MATVTAISEVTNDGRGVIESSLPYDVRIGCEGVAPFLFHRWSVDGVDAKAKAAKGSKAKKEDNIESYVYRNEDRGLCIPAEYLRGAMIHAAKYKQDPRSPRKSAMDIVKAGIASLEELCSTGKATWDFIDRRRVTVQRSCARPEKQRGISLTGAASLCSGAE